MKEIWQRAFWMGTGGSLLMVIYFLINQRSGVSHSQVTMPGWVPFWPVLVWPYLGMLIVPGFGVLTLQGGTRFQDSLRAVCLSFLMTCVIWIVFPTEMARPFASAGGWNDLYLKMGSIDKPVNILPCGHILVPCVVLWFRWSEWRKWRVPLLLLFTFGVVSIIVTWQHRPVDVLSGILIALGACVLCDRGRSRSRRGA